jgi:hypothetical protein
MAERADDSGEEAGREKGKKWVSCKLPWGSSWEPQLREIVAGIGVYGGDWRAAVAGRRRESWRAPERTSAGDSKLKQAPAKLGEHSNARNGGRRGCSTASPRSAARMAMVGAQEREEGTRKRTRGLRKLVENVVMPFIGQPSWSGSTSWQHGAPIALAW